jgi:two-component system nitrogen regulation response regulator NtrX
VSAPLHILVVDDDAAVVQGVTGLLRDEGFVPHGVSSAQEAWAFLEQAKPSPALMLLDIRMPEESGLELLERLPRPLAVPVVVLSGEASAKEAIDALKLGASDFVEKPPTAERLLTAVRNALALEQLQAQCQALQEELKRPDGLVGDSSAMRQLRETLSRVGPAEAVVLITGETGTGKERVSRALHAASRRTGRFIAVNCAAIPETLLESELFGHERGAFTGATQRRVGRIESADKGTLLLDEIGDMPLELQSKLLRVLEEREVERLGGTSATRVDVRVLAATHRDLSEAVKAGTFRQDLFYRLNVFPLRVPPLRERPEDLVPLIQAFCADLAGGKPAVVEPEAERALRAYAWPGNVRELRNFVERLSLLKPAPWRIQPGDVALLDPTLATALPKAATADRRSYREQVDDFERTLLKRTLQENGGNIAAAARALKMDRGNLHRRLQALGVEAEVST